MSQQRNRERDRAATVLSQDGEQLTVKHEGERLLLRMVGFPPGFTLRKGDRVIVVDEPDEVVARPLVRTVVADLSPTVVPAPGPLEVEGHRFMVEDATIISPVSQAKPRPASGRQVLWVVETEVREGPERVIATRPGR